MSAPLVSPGLIKKMRKIANRGLQTPVMLLRRLPVVDANGEVEGLLAFDDLVQHLGNTLGDVAQVIALDAEVTGVAILCAAATIFFGIVPSPLFDLARDVATSFSHLV